MPLKVIHHLMYLRAPRAPDARDARTSDVIKEATLSRGNKIRRG